MKKTYNSKHQFDSLDNARKFVEAIKNVGFTQTDYDPNGGVIYSNTNGYKLLVFVKK